MKAAVDRCRVNPTAGPQSFPSFSYTHRPGRSGPHGPAGSWAHSRIPQNSPGCVRLKMGSRARSHADSPGRAPQRPPAPGGGAWVAAGPWARGPDSPTLHPDSPTLHPGRPTLHRPPDLPYTYAQCRPASPTYRTPPRATHPTPIPTNLPYAHHLPRPAHPAPPQATYPTPLPPPT